MTKKNVATKRKPGKIAKSRNEESGVHAIPELPRMAVVDDAVSAISSAALELSRIADHFDVAEGEHVSAVLDSYTPNYCRSVVLEARAVLPRAHAALARIEAAIGMLEACSYSEDIAEAAQ